MGIKSFFWLLLVGGVLSACFPCKYPYCMEGAQEFVLDSYQIAQGKFSILGLEGKEVSSLPASYLQEYEDVIDEDDVLRVALFHPTRTDLATAVTSVGQTVGYRVINGVIHLPGLGETRVKGLTLDEARAAIQEGYGREIDHVSIFLEYAQRLHSTVDLIGAVRVTAIPINGRVRLYEVLSHAGVPAEANFFKSYVVRRGEILAVDLSKLVRQGDMSQNIVMYPQDKIFIADPLASTVTVLGEVGTARVVPVPNGALPLREALAAAGGIPFTGDKRCIQIIRGNIVNPKIYRLSWSDITYLPNNSLLLMPGDTVYITEKPITKWNRFIEQLLPSSLLIDLGIKTRGYFS